MQEVKQSITKRELQLKQLSVQADKYTKQYDLKLKELQEKSTLRQGLMGEREQ